MAAMDQTEAMWLEFAGHPGECGVKYPFAVKIAAGRTNAVTGEVWFHHLNRDPQDYLVIPEQPWLDGYCAGDEAFRQFVAAPPGIEAFPETEVTIGAETAVLQILVFPIKAARYRALVERKRERVAALLNEPQVMPFRKGRQTFALTPGGCAEEQILDDPHTLDAWDQRRSSRCFVIVLNSEQWMEVMGEHLPTASPAARTYLDADEDCAALATERAIPLGDTTSIEGPFDAAGQTSDPAFAPSGRVYRRARKCRPVREAGP